VSAPPPGALALLALLVAGLPAQEPAVLVLFERPPAGKPAIGPVAVVLDVVGDAPVTELVLWVDGVERGRRDRAPWRFDVDLGEENRGHRFEAAAFAGDRELGRGAIETPAFRVDEALDLGLRQLYVSVTRGGGAVSGLSREDFTVIDDGQPQELVTFDGGDAALTVALLLDASASMEGVRLEAAVGGVEAFLAGLGPLDEAEVLAFDDLLRGAVRVPASGAGAWRETIGQLRAAGGTAVNDMLYLALRSLEARQGRRVVVLLSDGVDVHSALSAEEVLWAQGVSDAAVYWIQLADAGEFDRVRSARRSVDEHGRERAGLLQVVERSGGRVVRVDSVAEIAAAFTGILAELRSQYVLGYYPTVDVDDGRWHDVEVRVAAPRLSVRTRRGYFDR
jgi:Ca-activated chloride channel homolog